MSQKGPSQYALPETPSQAEVIAAISEFGEEGCTPAELWEKHPHLLASGQKNANRVVRHLLDCDEIYTNTRLRLYIPLKRDAYKIEF